MQKKIEKLFWPVNLITPPRLASLKLLRSGQGRLPSSYTKRRNETKIFPLEARGLCLPRPAIQQGKQGAR